MPAEMSAGTNSFVPPTPRGMEKFMQLYYQEGSDDETDASSPLDRPDQASRAHVHGGAVSCAAGNADTRVPAFWLLYIIGWQAQLAK